MHYDVYKSYLIPIATQDARMYKKSEACMNFIFSRDIRSDKYMIPLSAWYWTVGQSTLEMSYKGSHLIKFQ